MTKKSRQRLKYLENKKSFKSGIKSIFYHFYRAFLCQKLSQTLEYAFQHNPYFLGKSCRVCKDVQYIPNALFLIWTE